mmetsp:Transcript_7256/g.20334  ORF Transcript_7256/g.20334 Transcript_7256/m.20334 type:complete len:202 (-) Transcript_7256:1230-1835(-)
MFPWDWHALASQVSRPASEAVGRMPSSFDISCWQNQRAPRPHWYVERTSQFGCRRGLQTICACIRMFSLLYGSSPVITWKSMTPRLHMSLFSVNDPWNISGDMYDGVPPTRVLRSFRVRPAAPPLPPLGLAGGGIVPPPVPSKSAMATEEAGEKISAMPKSASMTCTGSCSASSAASPGLPTRSTLSHFKSLWITPATSWA